MSARCATGSGCWTRRARRRSRPRSTAERDRIARELHDIVSHNVSLMIIQAGAARQVLADAAAGRGGGAAGGRVQRPRGDDRAAHPARPARARTARGEDDLTPQPGMSRLDELVDRVAFAGLPVELTVEGRTAAAAARDRPHRVPGHPGGPDQRAQACAGRPSARSTSATPTATCGWRSLNTGPSVLTGHAPPRHRRRITVGQRPGPARPARAGRRLRRPPRRAPPPRRRIPGAGEDPAVTRVLIADDQALVRTGFTMILDRGRDRGRRRGGRRRWRRCELARSLRPDVDPDGHPDAAAGRPRGDPAGPGRPAGRPASSC